MHVLDKYGSLSLEMSLCKAKGDAFDGVHRTGPQVAFTLRGGGGGTRSKWWGAARCRALIKLIQIYNLHESCTCACMYIYICV